MKRWIGIAVRIAFVIAAVVFAIWGFWDDWPDIFTAIAATEPWRIILAIALIGLALTLTLPVWMLLARSFGHILPHRASADILYVSQLGKYIPGSLWSVGAQMQMSRRYAVPLRTSAAVGLLFIGVHLASSVAVAGIVVASGGLPLEVPWWVGAIVTVAALITLTPPVLSLLSRAVGGASAAPRFTWITFAAIVGLMAVNWLAWGVSSLLLFPEATAQDFALVLGATTLAYAAGLVVFIAPAGIGIREAVIVAMLAPTFGVPAAAGVALLSRLAAALVDFSWAGGARLLARRVPDQRS